ncbi:MAG: hypothetical protein U0Y82_05980 [Thermoleophilia bacterium]
MEHLEEIARVERRIEELRAEVASTGEREAAGELGDLDQHQADQASEMEDRERTLGVIEQLERHLRRLRTGEADDPLDPAPGAFGDEDDSTPLDAPEPREDLSAIPMAWGEPADDPDLVADPQEDSGEPDIDMPGATYPHEGGAPVVGRPEPGDDRLEREYRPD